VKAHVLLLVLAAFLTGAGPADAVADALASVVEVRAPGSTGTGFMIEGDRVVTAAHVVESSPVTVVTATGSRSATILLHDPATDLAVLQVDGALDIRPLELSEQLPKLAEDVFAATAQPFGGMATVSRGIVSGVVQQAAGQVVQTDAAVNPGSSGGPLLRADGVVVGVISSKLDGGEGVAFAIPTPTLIEILDRDDTGTTGTAGTDASAPFEEREEAIGRPSDEDTATRIRAWLPVTAPAVLLLTAVLAGAVLERRRRRRPPTPGPFDIDVRLHDARMSVQVRSDNRKDV
jgi:S1-C subfamily serine protease